MKKAKWIFIYWMPYDNNLSSLKDKILEMLIQACDSADILIYVFSDSYNQKFIKQTGISNGKIFQDIDLKFQDSSDPKFLRQCLLNLLKKNGSEKWGFSILGHSGRIDEISPDEHTGKENSDKCSWMNIVEVKEALLDFTSKLGRKLDLIFLQNCCKGTIEANYNFKQVAQVILSSQKELGAPNYYYKNTFQYLSRYPKSDGNTLARIIAETEAETMYYSYTVLNTIGLDKFIQKLNKLLKTLVDQSINRNIAFNTYSYAEEQLIDLNLFLRQLSKNNKESQILYWDLNQFYTGNLLSYHKTNQTKFLENLSGLSLFYPSKKKDISKYSHLDFYKDVNLEELFHKLI